MSNLVRYAPGSLAPNWTQALGSNDLNSLGSGACVVSTLTFDNTNAGDLWASVSFTITATTSGFGAPNLALYVLPLNGDSVSYGDNVAGGSVIPSVSLFEQAFQLPLGQSSASLYGTFRRVVMPEGGFRFAIVNNSGNALAASGHIVRFRTFVENLNG